MTTEARADEWGRGAHAELARVAAVLDRLRAGCPDVELAAKLAPIRGHVAAAMDDLGERCGMVRHTPEQLAYFRRHPWDKP